MDKQEEKLVATIEALYPDIIDFTYRLIAQDSTLGNEAAVLQVMEDELRNLGYVPVRVDIDQRSYLGILALPQFHGLMKTATCGCYA